MLDSFDLAYSCLCQPRAEDHLTEEQEQAAGYEQLDEETLAARLLFAFIFP